jgi:hypothetical protein
VKHKRCGSFALSNIDLVELRNLARRAADLKVLMKADGDEELKSLFLFRPSTIYTCRR